jgi:hypothetical protein
MHFPFVDRMHVGASEAQVEEALRRALKPGISGSHPAVFRKYLKMALKQHQENREMYGYVMGGMHRPKRKNPELLIVRNPSPKGGVKMATRKKSRRRRYKVGRKLYTYQRLVKAFGAKRAKSIRAKRRKGGKRRARRSFRKSRKSKRSRRKHHRNRR